MKPDIDQHHVEGCQSVVQRGDSQIRHMCGDYYEMFFKGKDISVLGSRSAKCPFVYAKLPISSCE